jgi:hypothetical protein
VLRKATRRAGVQDCWLELLCLDRIELFGVLSYNESDAISSTLNTSSDHVPRHLLPREFSVLKEFHAFTPTPSEPVAGSRWVHSPKMTSIAATLRAAPRAPAR